MESYLDILLYLTTDFNNKSNTKECVTKPIRWIADKKNLFVDPLNHLDLLDINSESYQLDLHDFVVNLNSLYIKSAMGMIHLAKQLFAIIPTRLLIDYGSINAVMKKEQHFITRRKNIIHVRLMIADTN